MPVEELISLCKERNVLVMLDGAHTPGQLPLSWETMGIDFAVGKAYTLIVLAYYRYFMSLDMVEPLLVLNHLSAWSDDARYTKLTDGSSLIHVQVQV